MDQSAFESLAKFVVGTTLFREAVIQYVYLIEMLVDSRSGSLCSVGVSETMSG